MKFIRKSKVSTESWVETENHRCLPSEVSLLLKLHHPNIVKVLLHCVTVHIIVFCKLYTFVFHCTCCAVLSDIVHNISIVILYLLITCYF